MSDSWPLASLRPMREGVSTSPEVLQENPLGIEADADREMVDATSLDEHSGGPFTRTLNRIKEKNIAGPSSEALPQDFHGDDPAAAEIPEDDAMEVDEPPPKAPLAQLKKPTPILGMQPTAAIQVY